MAKYSHPLDPAPPPILCERCGKHPAEVEYGDDDVTPPVHLRVCGDCSEALSGRNVAAWLKHGIPDFPEGYYRDIKSIDSMTDEQARTILRNWRKANPPD